MILEVASYTTLKSWWRVWTLLGLDHDWLGSIGEGVAFPHDLPMAPGSLLLIEDDSYYIYNYAGTTFPLPTSPVWTKQCSQFVELDEERLATPHFWGRRDFQWAWDHGPRLDIASLASELQHIERTLRCPSS